MSQSSLSYIEHIIEPPWARYTDLVSLFQKQTQPWSRYNVGTSNDSNSKVLQFQRRTDPESVINHIALHMHLSLIIFCLSLYIFISYVLTLLSCTYHQLGYVTSVFLSLITLYPLFCTLISFSLSQFYYL